MIRSYSPGMDRQVRELRQQLAQRPDEPDVRERYRAALVRGHSLADCGERLSDLQRWDATGEVEQDAVMAWVAHGDPGLVWLGAETFRCGEQVHRVGVFRHEQTGLVLHLAPGGTYVRGTADPAAELAFWRGQGATPEELDALSLAMRDEVPAHSVSVRPFLIARETMTQGQRRRMDGAVLPSPGDSSAMIARRIKDLEEWVGGLRLPGEAEWEWACRAGSATRFFWGDAVCPPDAQPQDVGACVNAFGLRRIVGGVSELCSDRFDRLQWIQGQRDGLQGYHPRSGPLARGDGWGAMLRGGRWDPREACRSARRWRCVRFDYQVDEFQVGARPVIDVRLGLPGVPPEIGAPAPASRRASRTLGAVTLELVRGDIVARRVDAVVNPANDQLAMGGGVAAALRAAGGVSIEREATRHAGAPLGAVIRTAPGSLPAGRVYHAVVIRYSLKGGTSTETVREVVRELVNLATIDQLDSLALPLLGAGVGGLTVERSLETIFDAFEEFAPKVARPLRVEVVVLDEDHDAARAFFDTFRDRAAREARDARLAEDYLEELRRRGGPT